MSFESPFKVLYNNAGAEVAAISGSQMDASRPGVGMLVKNVEDGGAEWLKVNAQGELLVGGLEYSTDSIKVYGSEDAPLIQDALDSYLLVRDNDAKMAITGAVESMDSNLSGKLDTLDSSVGAVETAVDNASSAISGAVDSMNSNLGGKLDAVTGSVDAAATAITNSIGAVSTSLDRFTFNGSNELLVNATVDVDLDYATDSVKIYGDESLAFAQVSGSGEMITMPIGSEGFAFLQAASGSVHHSDDNSALLVGLMGSNSQNVLLSSTDDVLYVSAALNDATISTNLQSISGSLAALEGALSGPGTALVVEATNLDIRDLSSATDSVTAHQGGDWYVHQTGSWIVDRVVATSATVVAESINASSVEVIAGGAAAFGASFYWSSPAGSVCYIRLGDTAASSSVYTVKLVNGGYYEMPERWAGKVQAISDATGGTLLVTKLG